MSLRARCITVLVAVAALTAPASLPAWGLDVHRFLTRRALEGLPAELRPFYAGHIEFVAEHSVDPDLWRVVGLRTERGDEPPNHFLDIDGLDEPRPFDGVPRTWEAYVARYGAARANQMGRLPWRIESLYGSLVEAFRDAGAGSRAYAADNARYLSAVIAHYVEDAHVPLHAVVNYDGQLTGQRGIHSRFETQLVLRRLSTYRLQPVRIVPVPDITAFVFDRLVEGESLVEGILEADRRASRRDDDFGDVYFAAFGEIVDPVVTRRLSEAASGVASVLVAAWTDAGRPDLTGRGVR